MPFTGFSIWKQTPLKKTFNFISKLPLLICKLEYLCEEIYKIYYHLQNFSLRMLKVYTVFLSDLFDLTPVFMWTTLVILSDLIKS